MAEMLPGNGEGFLVAVLRHYSGNAQTALNALLEGSLPAELDSLDRSLKAPPIPKGSLRSDEGGRWKRRRRRRRGRRRRGAAAAAGGAGGGGGGGGGGGAGGLGISRRTDTVQKRRALAAERAVIGDERRGSAGAPRCSRPPRPKSSTRGEKEERMERMARAAPYPSGVCARQGSWLCMRTSLTTP